MRRVAARFTPLARLAEAPCPRSSHGVSAINKRLYVFGGESTARTPIDSSCHVLDVEQQTWHCVSGGSCSPPPRVGHAQAVVGTSLLIFGGRTGVQMGEQPLNDMWSLNTKTEVWEEQQHKGDVPSPRSFHRMSFEPRSF